MKDKVERLNFSVNLEDLRTFYNEIKNNNLKWTFSEFSDHLHPITVQKYDGYNYNGLPYGWALTSPHAIDTPTSPWAITNYAPGTSQRPTALVTGIVQKILDAIPKSAFELSLTVHPPGAEIVKHSDGDNTLRVHIPIHNTTHFIIDDNGEQTYELVPDGVPYLIDTRYQHRTINPLQEDRVSLIFGIPLEAEESVKSINGLITV
jgi:hypothetical protein